MSQESLKQETEEMARQWAAISKKHQAALAELAMGPRLTNVDRTYMQVAAIEAWKAIVPKCPKKKGQGGPDAVFEFLTRRIPELK